MIFHLLLGAAPEIGRYKRSLGIAKKWDTETAHIDVAYKIENAASAILTLPKIGLVTCLPS